MKFAEHIQDVAVILHSFREKWMLETATPALHRITNNNSGKHMVYHVFDDDQNQYHLSIIHRSYHSIRDE